ncbi:uncharacterized protein LOC134690399 [Mytilus trossulus]|uniref:uncharacterized protein LOC134690399 n=1 Tax=Mytilus trossulus TaxID=6551 RepID=UPI003006EDA8
MKVFAALSIVVVFMFTKQVLGVYEDIEEIPTANCVRKCEGKGRVKAECIRMCDPVPLKMCVEKCKENGFTGKQLHGCTEDCMPTPAAPSIDYSGDFSFEMAYGTLCACTAQKK